MNTRQFSEIPVIISGSSMTNGQYRQMNFLRHFSFDFPDHSCVDSIKDLIMLVISDFTPHKLSNVFFFIPTTNILYKQFYIDVYTLFLHSKKNSVVSDSVVMPSETTNNNNG